MSSLPALSIWQWATIAAVLFVLFVLEGAYQLIREVGAEGQFRKVWVKPPQPGILDSIVGGKRAAREIQQCTIRLVGSISRFGPRMIRYGAQFGTAGEDVAKLTRVARRATWEVNRYYGSLVREGRRLQNAAAEFERNYTVYVTGLGQSSDALEKRKVIEAVLVSSKSASEGWTKHMESGTPLIELNIYEPLTTAVKRLQQRQLDVIAVFQGLETATAKMLSIIDQKNTPATASIPGTATSPTQSCQVYNPR